MQKGLEFSMATIVMVALSIAIIAAGIALIDSLRVELPKIEKGMPPFFSMSTVPERGQEGTGFNIILDSKKIPGVFMMKAEIMRDSELVSSAILKDDGNHGDRGAEDGIYAGLFDSKGQEEGVYDIALVVNPGENEVRYYNTSKFMIFKSRCIPIISNGNPESKIDIAIIPSGYSDFEKFREDALKLADYGGSRNGVFSYRPFKISKDKFNVYIINSTEDLECKKNCQGIPSLICCNDDKVSKAAMQCPSDDVFVLMNSEEFCGTASYYAKVCSGWNIGQVGTHEFGHIFAGLGDEYDYQKVYPGYKIYETAYPNCDVNKCPKWRAFWDGCYGGCGTSNLFKPTKGECIMYTYVSKFDPVCERTILGFINEYKDAESNLAAPAPSPSSYVIGIGYDNGKLREKEVYVTSTKSPDYKIAPKVDYIAKIISEEGRNIYTFKFEMPKLLFPAPPVGNETAYSPVVLDSLNHTILAPYFDNAKKIEVYSLYNQKVLDVDVSYFSKTCGDGTCQQYENSIECSEDCKGFVSDNVCNYAKDGVCDPDCRKADLDCSRIDLRMVAIISASLAIMIALAMFRRRK